jgi:hypothetical protein
MIDLELLSETPQPTRRVKADLRCTVHEFTHCGQSRLLHVQLLLTQHFFAVASSLSQRRSLCRQSGRSTLSILADSKPTFRCDCANVCSETRRR